MYTIQPKKVIILNILDILKKYTDDNHTLTQKEIQDKLETEYLMKIERKAVKRNLMELIDCGYDIDYDESKPRVSLNKKTGEYEENRILTNFHIHHDFEDYEIKLLIDSIVFSNHIPKKYRDDIIEKLEGLTSVYFKNSTKNIEVINNTTAQNKEWFINLDTINHAIIKNCKIKFKYNEYGIDKKLHPKREKTVNPYKVVAHNNHYYLLCKEEPYDNISPHRIDKITELQELEEEHFEPIRSIDVKEYLSSHPYMFSGQAQHVKMVVNKESVGSVIDFFSDDFKVKEVSEDKLEIDLKSNADDVYYWSLQYGNYAEIIEPQELRDRIRITVETMSKTYLTSDDDKYEQAVYRAKKKHWLLLTYIDLKKKTFEEVPTDITGLMLIGNTIDNTDFLNRFSELITIHISNQEVGSFEFLEKQKNLRDLTIGCCGFFDLKHIKNCKNLKYLDLLDGGVGSLEVLKKLPKLKSLKVTAELAEKIDIKSLKKNNSELKVELYK